MPINPVRLIGPDGHEVNSASLIGKPITSYYKTNNDVAHITSWALQRNPFLDLFKIEQMLLEPGIRLGLRMRKTPLRKATLLIKSKNPNVRRWVATCLQRVWRGGLKKILRGFEYGFSACEVLYRAEPDDSGEKKLFISGLKEFHPRDVRPLTIERELCGVRVRSFTTDANSGTAGMNSKLIEGTSKKDLFNPKVFWYAHDAHFGNHFGRSILMGAQTPFEEMSGKGGARDSRAHFYYKHAFRGPTITYPLTDFVVDTNTGSVRYVNAQDVAAEMAVNAHNGSATLIPNVRDPKTGEPLFKVEFPQTGGQSGVDIRDYTKDLTKEEWQGLGVPEEVIQGGETGAYSARQIPERAFYTAAEDDLYDLLDQLDTQVLRPVAILNYGPDVQYEIEVMELTPEEQPGSDDGGGMPGMPGGFPPDAGGDDDSGSGIPPEMMQAIKDGSNAGATPRGGVGMSRQQRRAKSRSVIKETVRAVRLSLPSNSTALVMGLVVTDRRPVKMSTGHEEGAHGLQMAGHSAADAVAALAIAKGLQLSTFVKNRIVRLIVQNPTMSPKRFMATVERILQTYQPQLAGLVKDSLIATWVKGGAIIANRLPSYIAVDAPDMPGEEPSEAVRPVENVGGGPQDHVAGSATAGSVAPLPNGVMAFYGGGEVPAVTFPGIDEAWADLQQKIPISAGEFYKLGDQARTAAFTVSYVTGKDTVEHIRQALLDVLASGGTLSDFRSQVGEVLKTSPIGPFHVDTIFRTNIQNAFHAGQQRVMADPLVSDAFPFVKYNGVADTRIRHSHQSMLHSGIPINGKPSAIYYSDDPVWNVWTPPNGFNCRCGLTYLTIRQAARRGVAEAKEWLRTGQPPQQPFRAHPQYQPDPGFASRPTISAAGAVAMSMMAGTSTAFAGSVTAPRAWRGLAAGQPIPSVRLSRFSRRDVVEIFGPVFCAVMHAPKGGMVINGKDYLGGQFIPSGEQAVAKQTATAQISKAKQTAGHEVTGMKKSDGIAYIQKELGYSEEQAAAAWKTMFAEQGDSLENEWQDVIDNAPIQDIAAADIDPVKSGNFKTMGTGEAMAALKKIHDDITSGIDANDVPGITSDLMAVGYTQQAATYLAGQLCDGSPGRKENVAGLLEFSEAGQQHSAKAQELAKGVDDNSASLLDAVHGPKLTDAIDAMTAKDLSAWWDKDSDNFYDELTGRLHEAGIKKMAAAKLAVSVSEHMESGDSDTAFSMLSQGLAQHGIMMSPQLKGISPEAMSAWWDRDPDHFLKQLQNTLQEQAGLKKLASAKIAVGIADAMEAGQTVTAYNALSDVLAPLGFKLPKAAEPAPEAATEEAPLLPPELKAAVEADAATDADVAGGGKPPSVQTPPGAKPKNFAKDKQTLDAQHGLLMDMADAEHMSGLKSWMSEQMGMSKEEIEAAAAGGKEGMKEAITKAMAESDKAKYVGWQAPASPEKSKAGEKPVEGLSPEQAANLDVFASAANAGNIEAVKGWLTQNGMSKNGAEYFANKLKADPAYADELGKKLLLDKDAQTQAKANAAAKMEDTVPLEFEAPTKPAIEGENVAMKNLDYADGSGDKEAVDPSAPKAPDGTTLSKENYSAKLFEAMQAKLASGESVVVSTHTKSTEFSGKHADLLKLNPNGNIMQKTGKGWQIIAGQYAAPNQLSQLAQQLGFPKFHDLPDTEEEKAKWASEIEEANKESELQEKNAEKWKAFVDKHYGGKFGAAVDAHEASGLSHDEFMAKKESEAAPKLNGPAEKAHNDSHAMLMKAAVISKQGIGGGVGKDYLTKWLMNEGGLSEDHAVSIVDTDDLSELQQTLTAVYNDTPAAKLDGYKAAVPEATSAAKTPGEMTPEEDIAAGHDALYADNAKASYVKWMEKHGMDAEAAGHQWENLSNPALKEKVTNVVKATGYSKTLAEAMETLQNGSAEERIGVLQQHAGLSHEQAKSAVINKSQEYLEGLLEGALEKKAKSEGVEWNAGWKPSGQYEKPADQTNGLTTIAAMQEDSKAMFDSIDGGDAESAADNLIANYGMPESAKKAFVGMTPNMQKVAINNIVQEAMDNLPSSGSVAPTSKVVPVAPSSGPAVPMTAEAIGKLGTVGAIKAALMAHGASEAKAGEIAHGSQYQIKSGAEKILENSPLIKGEKPEELKPVIEKLSKKQILSAKSAAVLEHIAGVQKQWAEAAGAPYDPKAAVKMALSTMTPENVAHILTTGSKAKQSLSMAAVQTGLSALGYGTNSCDGVAALKKLHMAAQGESADDIARAVKAVIESSPAHKAIAAAGLNPDGTSKPIEDVDGKYSVLDHSIGGSTGAKKVSMDGAEFVLKSGGNDGGSVIHQEKHAANEVATNNLLDMIGVSVPKSKAVKVNGKTHAANAWLNIQPVGVDELKTDPGVMSSFAAQALLGNWDAIGASVDNVGKDEHGNIVFIDNGGAGGYRARGKPKKPEDWGAGEGSIVKELSSMRTTGNAGSVWGSLSDANVAAQIASLSAKVPPHETLANMAKASGLAYDDAQAKEYADTVHARLAYMKDWAAAVQAGVQKPPASAAHYANWKAEFGDAIHTNHAEKAKFKVQKQPDGKFMVQQSVGGKWKDISEPIDNVYHAMQAAQQAKAKAIGGTWKPKSSASGVTVHSAKPGSVNMAGMTYQVKEHQVGDEKNWTVEKQTAGGNWIPLKSFSGKTGLATAKKFITKAVSKTGFIAGSHGEKFYGASGATTHDNPELPALYSEHKWHAPITQKELSAAKAKLKSAYAYSSSQTHDNMKIKDENGNQLLAEDEAAALVAYFNGKYHTENDYLRQNAAGETPDDPATDGYAKLVCTALAKVLRVKGGVTGKLWRGVNFTSADFDRYEEAAKTGEVIMEPHFASTSTDPKKAFDKNTVFEIHASGLWAPDVHKLSQCSTTEMEALCMSGARYRVVGVDRHAKPKPKVILEEVP